MIALEGVTVRQSDGTEILRDVDLHAGAGEKVVLLGSNGSGKTTLLRVLDGLIEPARGRFVFDDRTVDARAFRDADFARRFRREVALLFQNPDSMLFHAKVADEIAFGVRQLGLDDVDGRVARWATDLGVDHLLDRVPFKLSSGEKQRVCLAALLAVEPKVLLLDEPTANLDPRSTGWLVDFLDDLDLTVITTTHNLSLARELGTRAVLLGEDHTVLHDGPLDAALDDLALLQRANLVHTHRHRHGDVEHRHPHVHDWD